MHHTKPSSPPTPHLPREGFDQGIGNLELGRRLGLHEKVVRRMLDPRHATKAEKIQAALAALGKQLTVEVRDAA
jgi:antitoxin HicB